ncbi:MAG: hypothetical protein QOG67_264 [Verrucomicrobiota bacterium]|jgi:hypothetical protein
MSDICPPSSVLPVFSFQLSAFSLLPDFDHENEHEHEAMIAAMLSVEYNPSAFCRCNDVTM